MFENRFDAGRQLAEKLKKYSKKKGVVVLAITRGGVEVGFEIAKNLHVKLDIIIAKKIGLPHNPELAVGAVTYKKVVHLNQDVIDLYSVPEEFIENEIKKLSKVIEEKLRLYKKSKLPALKNKIVILTDDGVATGATFFAAIKYIREEKPKKLITAIPVASQESLREIENQVDEVICLERDLPFGAVGAAYRSFPQVSDEEVIKYLKGQALMDKANR